MLLIWDAESDLVLRTRHTIILQVANTVTIDRQQFHKNTFRWRSRDGNVQLRCEFVADYK